MRTRRPTGPQPYAHDADYIEHLILGVRARAHHLGTRHDAIQEAEEAAGHVISLVGVGTPAGSPQVGRLAAIDRQVWADIDARREVTAAAGTVLGLDALCEQYDLDPIERDTLILAMIPAVGDGMMDVFGALAACSMAIMWISPELVAVFGGLDVAGRIDLIERFGPDGKLVSAGLVTVERREDDHIEEFWGATIRLTRTGFDRITGRVSTGASEAPCTGDDRSCDLGGR